MKRKLLILGVCTLTLGLTACSPTFNREVKKNDIMGNMTSDIFMTPEQKEQRKQEKLKEKQEKEKQEQEQEQKQKPKGKYKWGADRQK